MDVTIKDLPELRVATLRHVGPYNQISKAFARLGEVAGPAGLIEASPTMLALYHDDPETTPVAELRSDAGLVISNEARLPAGLGEQRLQAGRYACTTHIGPYEELGDVWGRFMGEWLPRSGHRMKNGAAYEIYRNMPGQVPPSQLQTDLYIPIE